MVRKYLLESSTDVSDSSDDNLLGYTDRTIRNPYERPSTSRNNTTERPTNATKNAKGAARRKSTARRGLIKQHKEIIRLQSTTDLLIPKVPFSRLVREISVNLNPDITRYTATAIEALQEATEMFLVQILEDSYLLTMHRKCVTLSKADLMLIRCLKFNL